MQIATNSCFSSCTNLFFPLSFILLVQAHPSAFPNAGQRMAEHSHVFLLDCMTFIIYFPQCFYQLVTCPNSKAM